jgi:hypothetical protein
MAVHLARLLAKTNNILMIYVYKSENIHSLALFHRHSAALFIMKVQNILLGHVLLHSTQALSLPEDAYSSLITRTNSKNSSLEWSRCNLDFGDKYLNDTQKSFDCARLEVPLDYSNSSNTKTIKLDLIRANATKTPYKGSVLFNPGGPGFSTLESLLNYAPTLLP